MTSAELAPGEFLFLDRECVESLLDPVAVVGRCEETFRWVGAGDVVQRNPVNLHVGDSPSSDAGSGTIQAFPAYVKPLGVAGLKWLAWFRRNPEEGLPAISATGMLNDASTGMPLAIFDATSLTNLRTAGHSGVGAKYMARPDSSVVAVLGCGSGGRSHLEVMTEIFDVERAVVFSRTPESVSNYIEEMTELLDVRIDPAGSVEEAVSEADIICVTTTSPRPILWERWVPSGAHVCAVTGFQDIDPKCARGFDKFVVGWYGRDLAWIDGEETGRLGGLRPGEVTRNDIYADLATEIIPGLKPGRESDRERTIMTHLGMPALDAAVAHLLLSEAQEAGAGTVLRLF